MAAYAISIFTGAFLLFQVQPLIGKYLLPWFGGGPGVWTTCMLFFQVVLLAGYAYAHASSRLLRPRHQVWLHMALILGGLLTLPIVPSEGWKPPDASDPVPRIIALLTVSLGLPYFTLSATAPLLQHWFSRAHPGVSPYRLYALSNTGSLLALLSYPTFFEVSFTRSQQALFWSLGLVIYAAACGYAGWMFLSRGDGAGLARSQEPTATAEHPGLWAKVLWVLLPMCASILLLAITNKISQDVAVIPFLWVLPLCFYLLSFIICFDRPSWYRRWWSAPALGAMLILVWFLLAMGPRVPIPLQIVGYSAALFVCCMVCHGEVYRLRPDAAHLTGFYLLISVGGALGGIFVAILAPFLFSDYYELQIALLGCGALFLTVLLRQRRPGTGIWPRVAWGTSLLLLGFLALTWFFQATRLNSVRISRSRNFYGVLSVLRHAHQNPELSLLELSHGRIVHGMQFTHSNRVHWPTLYYTAESGIGRALSMFPPGKRRVGAVGQGAGTLAAFGEPGDVIRFYEINPEVDRVAREQFSFLANSRAKVEVILGDARLTLEKEPDQNFDVLALDAFSSDAIPVHLLTREAFELYRRHLKPGGILAVHVSNMSLNLEPVVVRAGQAMGFSAFVVEFQEIVDRWWVLPSTWVLLTRDQELGKSAVIRRAARPAVDTSMRVEAWTDDFAALFPTLRWREFVGGGSKKVMAMITEAVACEQQGDLAKAIKIYRNALEIQPNLTVALNNLAWLLATAGDPWLRDGAEAVRRAERACAITQYRMTLMVGTLAAAYAEAGRFAEAVAAGEEACTLAKTAGQDDLLRLNERMLALYRGQKPFHEEPAPPRL